LAFFLTSDFVASPVLMNPRFGKIRCEEGSMRYACLSVRRDLP